MFHLSPYTFKSSPENRSFLTPLNESVDFGKHFCKMSNYSLLAISLCHPHCFQLDPLIVLSFIDNFNIFVYMFSMSSAADVLYVEQE